MVKFIYSLGITNKDLAKEEELKKVLLNFFTSLNAE